MGTSPEVPDTIGFASPPKERWGGQFILVVSVLPSLAVDPKENKCFTSCSWLLQAKLDKHSKELPL